MIFFLVCLLLYTPHRHATMALPTLDEIIALNASYEPVSACIIYTAVGQPWGLLAHRMEVGFPLLRRHFNDRWLLPIFVMHTSLTDAQQEVLRTYASPNDTLKFVNVSDEWGEPQWLREANATVRSQYSPHLCLDYSPNYRYAQRFFMYTLFTRPELRDYEYFVRLDTDLFFTRTFPYDVLQVMRAQRRVFGFLRDGPDNPSCNRDMWPTAERYMAARAIDVEKTWFRRVPEYHSYTAYFGIGRTDFFQSDAYLDMAAYFDAAGGVFKYRWTDGDFHLLAMSVLGSHRDALCFGDLDDFVIHTKVPSFVAEHMSNRRFDEWVFTYKSDLFDNANESLVVFPSRPR